MWSSFVYSFQIVIQPRVLTTFVVQAPCYLRVISLAQRLLIASFLRQFWRTWHHLFYTIFTNICYNLGVCPVELIDGMVTMFPAKKSYVCHNSIFCRVKMRLLPLMLVAGFLGNPAPTIICFIQFLQYLPIYLII